MSWTARPNAGRGAPKIRVGVLISGRGSNMLALLDAAEDPDYPAEFALVLSNEPEAAGLAAAAARGIPTATVPHRAHPRDKAGFEAGIEAALRGRAVELICLAGFMRVLSGDFVSRWRDRILNIHPSLLPAFPGLDTHARALAAGAKLHGASVHLVREVVDDGPILAQAALAVRPEDTPDDLAARVLGLEHRIYPAALARYATGAPWSAGDGALISPM